MVLFQSLHWGCAEEMWVILEYKLAFFETYSPLLIHLAWRSGRSWMSRFTQQESWFFSCPHLQFLFQGFFLTLDLSWTRKSAMVLILLAVPHWVTISLVSSTLYCSCPKTASGSSCIFPAPLQLRASGHMKIFSQLSSDLKSTPYRPTERSGSHFPPRRGHWGTSGGTSGIWPGSVSLLSIGIAHLIHLLSICWAARKSYTWHMPCPSPALDSKGSSGERLWSPCGSGEPQEQRRGPAVRDKSLMRSDSSTCALVSHLWCDLMQEKREHSTSLTEHLFLCVSFSFTACMESVCCATLSSCQSLGNSCLLTIFPFPVSLRAFLDALWGFSVFIILWAFYHSLFPPLALLTHKSCKEAGHVCLLSCCTYDAQIRKVKKFSSLLRCLRAFFLEHPSESIMGYHQPGWYNRSRWWQASSLHRISWLRKEHTR